MQCVSVIEIKYYQLDWDQQFKPVKYIYQYIGCITIMNYGKGVQCKSLVWYKIYLSQVFIYYFRDNMYICDCQTVFNLLFRFIICRQWFIRILFTVLVRFIHFTSKLWTFISLYISQYIHIFTIMLSSSLYTRPHTDIYVYSYHSIW